MIYAYLYKRKKVNQMTRWTVVVSEQTDQQLRAFLGQLGAKKGDLSRYVEQAVNRCLLEDTVKQIKERNAVLDRKSK